MKLTYWHSACPDDSASYSVRERTRKAAAATIATKYDAPSWPAPRKVSVEYDSAFELLNVCSNESHHYWEA
jgi:hypothetical protein